MDSSVIARYLLDALFLVAHLGDMQASLHLHIQGEGCGGPSMCIAIQSPIQLLTFGSQSYAESYRYGAALLGIDASL